MAAASASTAHAEREPYLVIGAGFDGRGYADELHRDPRLNGGLRATLSLEDPPLAYPEARGVALAVRLVPELFTGFIANDVRAEGYVGAGLRGELHLASSAGNRSPIKMRGVEYLAVRGKITGEPHDVGGELVGGTYVTLGRSTVRFGFEGGVGVINRPSLPAGHNPEVEALATLYLGGHL